MYCGVNSHLDFLLATYRYYFHVFEKLKKLERDDFNQNFYPRFISFDPNLTPTRILTPNLTQNQWWASYFVNVSKLLCRSN